jgi:hypothetical protein
MFRRLIIIGLLLLHLSSSLMVAQIKSAFTGDITTFKTELVNFMGPNLNSEQKVNLNQFLVSWDSAAFSKVNMITIVDIANQLSDRLMRPVPHFNDFMVTVNSFVDNKGEDVIFSNWLKGLSEITFNPRISNDNIIRYFKNTSSMIKENVLSETGSVRWKVKNSKLRFEHDTMFYVKVTDATLTCYFQTDSTEIYNVTGNYYPELQQFIGSKGIVTWEKAGYTRKEVSAEITSYIINTSKNNFTVDSAKLTNNAYFRKPEFGKLTDQTASYKNKETATYPRFITYTKEFKLKNIFKGVNYEGGLSFEGAHVKGTGEKYRPAKILLYRKDTLYLKITSGEFLFSKTGLNSPETSMSLYLQDDSIYHSNLGFSYIAETRQVNLFRTSNPVSKSPYFNSFHELDMYFEYLSWNMNDPKIVLSRARGSSLGQARFESISYFKSEDFFRLMGLDNYHPLNRLVKFSEWYYSETFPVTEFAKWLNKPEEAVTGLCIDLANKGFIFYDRTNNEVTIKKKTKDYLDSYAKRKDYDVIDILSETKAPIDNAILNLSNYKITVNGVKGVFLSDSQKVAIYPYNDQLIIGKNRNLQFNGMVEAGNFIIYGHNFSFSYDTFDLRLGKIDSIRVAVETEKKDIYGDPLSRQVNNILQMGSAELFIDKPNNKSGLKSLKQYPIISTNSFSYIFYDKIPGLEGIYKQKDFYFKVDPYTYEDIDHFNTEDMNLPGEFVGGNILKPTRQFLIILENNSFGFNMTIPKEGIELYGGKARLFDTINMSNIGLVGSGKLMHLTSTTSSKEYKFFPDSMTTHASTFSMSKDSTGLFPVLDSREVDIKWLTQKDKWHAIVSPGKTFSMFANGTTLDGTVTLSPDKLNGDGTIDMTNSRIKSNLFSFTSSSIKADTADYNLKSLTTNGYSFIAENANTYINFDSRMSNFHLNTDSSMVKFPELEYICTMTDFTYNMETRILNMEQKGKSNTPLLTPDKLIRLNYLKLDKPTFFATNSLRDTISFSSWKGSYHLDQEYIEAENINYIHIADALIQPKNGKIMITRRAQIQPLDSAIIALNNRHILHSAKINIESTGRYSGSAVYDYINDNKEIQKITFPQLTVDTLITSGSGFIPAEQNFRLSSSFTFAGDVILSSKSDQLTFTGAAGIMHNCSNLNSYSIKFKSKIDPKNVMIPVSDKPRDLNDNLVVSGSFINTDSTHIYPAFLSPQKSWSDVGLVTATGFLWFDKSRGRYLIASLAKLADQKLPGNMIVFDKNYCMLTGEGSLNFGAKLDLVNLKSAGKVIHSVDSGKVNIEAILALDFYFSPEALRMMADEIRMKPSLKSVNLNSELNNKGMKDLMGADAAAQIKEEIDLFGTSKNLPKEFNYELLLNDVKLKWNESTSSFRSSGKIGIGFIGPQPVNVYVDGYIELQRRRTGDLIDIYLKTDESTWYYFSYFRGVMMTQSSNSAYNSLIVSIKQNDRKHPESSVRTPYTYMISVENRVERFLSRMADESDQGEGEPLK